MCLQRHRWVFRVVTNARFDMSSMNLSGNISVDYPLLRQISSICNQLPTMDGAQFSEEFMRVSACRSTLHVCNDSWWKSLGRFSIFLMNPSVHTRPYLTVSITIGRASSFVSLTFQAPCESCSHVRTGSSRHAGNPNCCVYEVGRSPDQKAHRLDVWRVTAAERTM